MANKLIWMYKYITFIYIFFLLSISSFSLYAKGAGIIISHEGIVQIKHPDKGAKPIAAGDIILKGDMITTSETGRANTFFNDLSLIHMGPGTSIEIVEFELNKDNNFRQSYIQLHRGVIRVISTKSYKKRSYYTISTPNAEVSVEGTTLIIEMNPRDIQTTVIVLKEFTVVRGLPEEEGPSARIKEFEYTTVELHHPPKSPFLIDSYLLNEYLEKTEVGLLANIHPRDIQTRPEIYPEDLKLLGIASWESLVEKTGSIICLPPLNQDPVKASLEVKWGVR